ncbi:MmcQ/YjbR family DNA-binding protein [Kitasatospora sp. NPDC054939]
MATPAIALDRLRAICLALPEAEERISHGEPTWFTGPAPRGRVFAMFADSHHDDLLAVWCPAPPGAQTTLTTEDPDRYFRPPYVGHRGWIGIRLDLEPLDWARIEDHILDAHTLIAPARLRPNPPHAPD